MTYFKNILIAISQLFNSLLFGYPDETLSARAYRKSFERNQLFTVIMFCLDLIFFVFTLKLNHCKRAYEAEVLKEQQDQSYDI